MGKGRLGVMVMSLTPELRQYFGAGEAGVLVARVEADSPAAKAGVRVGDVLTKTADQEIDDAGDVRAALASFKKGDAVELGIVREHKPVSLRVTLADDAPPPMPNMESMWSKDWFRDFMKSFDELKKPLKAPQTKT
jgi:S1-C subfamily serine protease